MKNLIFVFACLLSFNLYGQTVYTEDQVVSHNHLVCNKSNNLPITGIVKAYCSYGKFLQSETPYKDGKKEGLEKRYDCYAGGAIQVEKLFNAGENVGVTKFYYYHFETGALKYEASYRDGYLFKKRCFDKSGNEIPCED